MKALGAGGWIDGKQGRAERCGERRAKEKGMRISGLEYSVRFWAAVSGNEVSKVSYYAVWLSCLLDVSFSLRARGIS